MNKLLSIACLTLLLVTTGCEVAHTPDYIETEETEETVSTEMPASDADENSEPEMQVNEDTSAEATGTNEVAAESEDPSTAVTAEFTLTAVATHNTKADCWSAINGKVYDLTDWIAKHPGGAGNIIKICGKDGSSAFSGQHGSNNSAQAQLAEFYLSDLQ
jgi:cytochrome b involved in lipid metabolism